MKNNKLVVLSIEITEKNKEELLKYFEDNSYLFDLFNEMKENDYLKIKKDYKLNPRLNTVWLDKTFIIESEDFSESDIDNIVAFYCESFHSKCSLVITSKLKDSFSYSAIVVDERSKIIYETSYYISSSFDGKLKPINYMDAIIRDNA